MKHILLFCNYFEGRTGNLEKCLESFQRCKKDNDVIVGFIDNGSTDNSYEIAQTYIKNKFIDYYIFNTKNVGKAKAQNSLLKYIIANNTNLNTEDTLIYLLDSDIQILNDALITNTDKIFTDNKDISLMSCNIIDETVNDYYKKRIYNDFYSSNITLNDLDFYEVKRQSGIAGAIMIIPLSIFIKVGMYNENLGKDKSSAIYGGDDAVLHLKIFKEYTEKKILICKSINYFHPTNKNQDYQKWKIKQCKLMCTNGFGNFKLENKGFFDE